MNDFIQKNYRRILGLRREGLSKYGSLFPHQFHRIPVAYSTPRIVLRFSGKSRIHKLGLRHHDIGSTACVVDAPVPWVVASRLLQDGYGVLDIGCSDGMFYKFLKLNEINVRYSGLDVDTSFVPDFEFHHSLKEVADKFDVVTMFHVIEHMPLDDLLELLANLRRLLQGPEVSILATPNVLNPGVFERDIGHVQPYPWYDLYAILRLFFQRIDVLRGHYLCTPLRIVSMPARIVAGVLTERDWCEEIVLIARGWNGNNANQT